MKTSFVRNVLASSGTLATGPAMLSDIECGVKMMGENRCIPKWRRTFFCLKKQQSRFRSSINSNESASSVN